MPPRGNDLPPERRLQMARQLESQADRARRQERNTAAVVLDLVRARAEQEATTSAYFFSFINLFILFRLLS